MSQARDPGACPLIPPPIAVAPLGVFETSEGQIELVGVALPAMITGGDRSGMRLVWRVVRPPPPGWRVFVHFDGAGQRFQADHEAAVCGPREWQPGALVVDRFTVKAAVHGVGLAPATRYQAFVGWFSGDRRADLSGDAAADDRLRVGVVEVVSPPR